MLQKKKGFTLVEVLVVILISGLVLSMVAGAMIFVTNSSGELIHQAEDIDMAKNIEKYLRELVNQSSNNEKFFESLEIDIDAEDNRENDYFKIDENGNLIETNTEKKVFSNTGLLKFKIYVEENSNLIKCYMKFDSEKEFEFILATVKNGG